MTPGYQYSAEPFVPDVGVVATVTHTFTGVAGARFKRYLIPLPGTIDRLKVNRYNFNISALAVDAPPKPPAPPPPTATGLVRIGLYRTVRAFRPAPITALTCWELVKGSTYTSGAITAASPLAVSDVAMAETIDVLGGEFFVCVQFEDNTPSGASFVTFNIDGHSATSTGVQYAYYTSTGTAGALPATIAGNTITLTSDMPFVGICWK